MKALDTFNTCAYEVVKSDVVEKQIVNDLMFVTLPERMNTRIECGKNHSVIQELTFSVDVECSIINDNMTIMGTRSHEVAINRNHMNIVRMYDHLKFATVNLSLIKGLDSEVKDNMIISQDTMNIVLPSIPVFLIICIILTIIIIYFKFCKPKLPKLDKKVESEVESPNSDRDAAKWIADYIRNNPRMSMNPYLKLHSNISRRNITPVIQFDD